MRAHRDRHRADRRRSSAPTPPLAADAGRRAPRARPTTWPAPFPARRRSRARRDLRLGRPRRHRDVPPAPLPLRADGDPRHRVDLGRLPPEPHRVDLDAGPPRRARLPRSRRSACRRTAIRVIMGDVGGGFGQKMFMLPDEVGRRRSPASASARPVKWIEDRRENLMAGPARPRRPDDDELRRSTPTATILGRAGRPRRGRRRPSPPPAAAPIGFVGLLFTGPVQDPARSGSRPRPSTRTRAGAARTAARG